MKPRLREKLSRLRSDLGCGEFILADARDPDMAMGVASPGRGWPSEPSDPYKSMAWFRDEIRAVVEQGLVDIMLGSMSTMGVLAHEERLFDGSDVTPAVRMNDTSDVWVVRGGVYTGLPSRPFSTTFIEETQWGSLTGARGGGEPAINLGLYSVTFNNDLEHDHRTLTAFHEFRARAERAGFCYFLEVFAPNVEAGLSPDEIPGFVNDHICRMLAGAPRSGRPAFLKMPFFGRRALEELVNYDPSVVVGVLGGGSGTTHSAFALLEQAREAGARVALFGRKIKAAEDPLAFIACLRRIADGELGAEEGVRAYHDELAKKGVPAMRTLDEDLVLTESHLAYAGG